MNIIIITDTDINEVIAAYTIDEFIKEANKEYYEENWETDDNQQHFNKNTLDRAIDYYIDTSYNLALDIIELTGA